MARQTAQGQRLLEDLVVPGGLVVGVEQDVGVGVDEARQQGRPGQFDHARVGRRRDLGGRPGPLDESAADEDDPAVARRVGLPVEDPGGPQEHGLFRRAARRSGAGQGPKGGKAQGGQGVAEHGLPHLADPSVRRSLDKDEDARLPDLAPSEKGTARGRRQSRREETSARAAVMLRVARPSADLGNAPGRPTAPAQTANPVTPGNIDGPPPQGGQADDVGAGQNPRRRSPPSSRPTGRRGASSVPHASSGRIASSWPGGRSPRRCAPRDIGPARGAPPVRAAAAGSGASRRPRRPARGAGGSGLPTRP